jgi:hypothetical protein
MMPLYIVGYLLLEGQCVNPIDKQGDPTLDVLNYKLETCSKGLYKVINAISSPFEAYSID